MEHGREVVGVDVGGDGEFAGGYIQPGGMESLFIVMQGE
jgi:hypothetical protein